VSASSARRNGQAAEKWVRERMERSGAFDVVVDLSLSEACDLLGVRMSNDHEALGELTWVEVKSARRARQARTAKLSEPEETFRNNVEALGQEHVVIRLQGFADGTFVALGARPIWLP
jgi:hypothetical protein